MTIASNLHRSAVAKVVILTMPKPNHVKLDLNR